MASNNQEYYDEILKELDEIKRYVAATYSAVDREIQEIMSHLKKLDRDIADNDRQLDRMEKYERTLNSIESSIRKIEGRIK